MQNASCLVLVLYCNAFDAGLGPKNIFEKCIIVPLPLTTMPAAQGISTSIWKYGFAGKRVLFIRLIIFNSSFHHFFYFHHYLNGFYY